MAAKGIAPLVLIAAATGAAAGWFAGANSNNAALPTSSGDSIPVVEELRRLGADLRAFAARPATAQPTSPTTERTDAAPPAAGQATAADERLLGAIEQLLVRVEQIATRQVADSGTLQRLAAERPVDSRALTELRSHIDGDWNTAQRVLFLMPMAAVLQRYGPPTRVDLQSSGMQWAYEFDVGDQRQWLGMTFHDGVVVKVD